MDDPVDRDGATAHERLRARWAREVAGFGAPTAVVEATFDDLATRYAEPQRRYHTLTHIEAVLLSLDAALADQPAVDRDAVVLAGWLHDVIYDPRRADNEAKSARYARQMLPPVGVGDPTVDETVRLIVLTAGHTVAPDDTAGRVLADADLEILAAPRTGYEQYTRAIREEYAHVPDDVFAIGRRAVLEGFLARPRIFLGDEMHARFDAAARANLRAELGRLHQFDVRLRPSELPPPIEWPSESS